MVPVDVGYLFKHFVQWPGSGPQLFFPDEEGFFRPFSGKGQNDKENTETEQEIRYDPEDRVPAEIAGG